MRAHLISLGLSLLLITPGAALSLLQEWTPFLLTVSGLAGTALALAVRNYRASQAQEARLNKLEVSVPKRRTDRVEATLSAHPAASLSPSVSGPQVTAAALPVAGEAGRDG